MNNVLKIVFKDEDDMKFFIQITEEARDNPHTVSPLSCGILSSVLRGSMLLDKDTEIETDTESKVGVISSEDSWCTICMSEGQYVILDDDNTSPHCGHH